MELKPSDLKAFNIQRPEAAREKLCHAPFKSMYFAHMGKVYACSANRSHILGTYPNQSVHDMWFGDSLRQLREAILKNDMSKGCYRCYNFIVGHNHSGSPLKDYDVPRGNAAGYPSKMDFELGNTCNLECLMCNGHYSSSIRRNRDKAPPIPQAYDEAFVEQLEEFLPYLETSLCLGGEPFLIPLYFSLWEKMIRLNPNVVVSVQTNATVLNKRVKNVLENLPVKVAVSMDSLEKHTFEKIRKNAKFERVMENLMYFIDYSRRTGFPFNISFCPMVNNWQEVPSWIEFCNKHDIHAFLSTVTHPRHLSFLYLPSARIREVIDSLSTYAPPSETHYEIANRGAYQDMLNQLGLWYKKALRREQWQSKVAARDVPSLFQGLKAYIREESGLEENGQEILFQKVHDRLDYVFTNASKAGYLDGAIHYFYDTDLDAICSGMTNLDKAFLYELVRANVLET